MILVRDIFSLRFGSMREALALWKEGQALMKASGHVPSRLLTDLTGEYYTLVLESEFASLSEYEKGHGSAAMTDEFRAWYQKFSALVVSGKREMFSIVK